MDIQSLLLVQLAVDILICLLLVLLLWRFGSRGEKAPADHSGVDMEELKKFMDESRRLSAEFVVALEEGRKNLKSLAFSLDERERRLQDLLARAENIPNPESREGKADPGSKGDPYGEVLRMIDEGLTEREVADRLGLPTGEIELIKSLGRRGNREPS